MDVAAQFLSFGMTVFSLFAPPYEARTLVRPTPGQAALIVCLSAMLLVVGGFPWLPFSVAMIAYAAAYLARMLHLVSLTSGPSWVYVWPDKAITLAMLLLLWWAGFYEELFAWAAG